MPTPAGWYTDPSGRYELRYWDGSRWTGDVRGQAPSGASAQDATNTPGDAAVTAADGTTAADLQAGDPEQHSLTRAERQASLHGAPRGRRRWLLIAAIVAVLAAGGVVAALSMSSDDTSVKTKPRTTTTEPHTSTTHASSTTSTSSATTTTTTTPGATTTTVAAKSTATTSAQPPASGAAALPPKVVTTGTWCTTAGDTAVNSAGTPMVCSATAKNGTPYAQPTWRPQ